MDLEGNLVKNSKAVICTIILGFALIGCKESGFTGGAQQAKVVQPHSQQFPPPQFTSQHTVSTPTNWPSNNFSPPIQPPLIQPPPGCTDSGITHVELLTPVLDLANPNRFVDYRISRTDCQGQAKQFAAERIWFDMDVYGLNHDLQYAVLENGVALMPKRLQQVNGSDLFGHTGPEWGHFETDEAFSLHSHQSAIHLRVFLGNGALIPRLAGPNADYNARIPTPTFLRFGNALPATRNVDVIHVQVPPGFAGGGLGTIF